MFVNVLTWVVVLTLLRRHSDERAAARRPSMGAACSVRLDVDARASHRIRDHPVGVRRRRRALAAFDPVWQAAVMVVAGSLVLAAEACAIAVSSSTRHAFGDGSPKAKGAGRAASTSSRRRGRDERDPLHDHRPRRRRVSGGHRMPPVADADRARGARSRRSAPSPRRPGCRGRPREARRDLYGQYCVACHGTNGAGVLQPKPIGAARGRAQHEQRARAAAARRRSTGRGLLPRHRLHAAPAHRRCSRAARSVFLRPADLGADRIRRLARARPADPDAPPRAGRHRLGQQTFTDRCAGCHQVVAEGGYVTGALPPPLEDATPTRSPRRCASGRT